MAWFAVFGAGPVDAQEPLLDDRPEKRRGARGARAGGLVLLSAQARFGDLYQGESVEHTWPITNRGTVEVRIEQAIAVDGTGRVEVVPRILAPGEAGLISVVQPLASALGEAAFRYALITDEPGVARYRFSLSGFVQSAFDPETAELRFPPSGELPGEPPRATAEVSSREVERLEILRAVDPPPFVDVSWSATGDATDDPVRIEAQLLPAAPIGIFGGSFAVETNVAHQPLLWIGYSGTVYRELVPVENPVALGVVTPGAEQVSAVEIRRASGAPFGEVEVTSSADSIAATIEPCSEPADACRAVRLRFAPSEPGPVTATVTVRATDVEELPLRVHGVGVSGSTRVRQLDLGGEG